jgi:hypothetical protein
LGSLLLRHLASFEESWGTSNNDDFFVGSIAGARMRTPYEGNRHVQAAEDISGSVPKLRFFRVHGDKANVRVVGIFSPYLCGDVPQFSDFPAIGIDGRGSID